MAKNSAAKKKVKRRTTARPASRKKAPVKAGGRGKQKSKPSRTPIRESEWFLEITAICLVTIATILTLCVLSVQFRLMYPQVPFFSSNLLGPAGRLLGTLGTGFLGWVALLPAIGMFVVATHLWLVLRDEAELSVQMSSKSLFSVGLLGTLLSSCVLMRIFGGVRAGGNVGDSLGTPLLLFFNTTGAAIIAGAVFLLSFAFATQNNTVDLLSAGFYGLRKVFVLACFVLPRVLFNALIDAVQLFYTAMAAAINYALNLVSALRELFEREEEEEDDEELPKPSRRSNRMPPVNDVDDEVEDDSDYTHVVVKRRNRDGRASKNLLGKARKIQEKQLANLLLEGFPPYTPPSLNMLTAGEVGTSGDDDAVLRDKSRLIEQKLRDFGISGRVTHVHPGPVITLFEFEPAAGVKVGRIASLQDDLAMSLRALSIRIIAPIPQRGTVGIEVPNSQRDLVRLRDCLESENFVTSKGTLSVPIGKDTYGDPVIADIAAMPHLLVAGATGTGKSVFINSLLMSLIYRASPAELGLILIDPKILELSVYDGIPHLRVPVVTVPRQAKAVLEWAVQEMERRYRLMHRYGVRSIDGYNDIARGEEPSEEESNSIPDDVLTLEEDSILAEGTEAPSGDPDESETYGTEVVQPLPKIVIVIDELADLMLTVGRDIEELITRLAQKARAAGIHLIVATQRPSVDVITGLIKANFPARISFRVSSRIDSRTILDNMGAERLLGRGDMLFMRPGAQHVQRIHGAYVADSEVTTVVADVKENCAPQYDPVIVAACEKAMEEEVNGSSVGLTEDEEYDAFYDKAVELVIQNGKASTSMIQRAFRIGYNRAARIIETMERDGVIGPMDGAKPRAVLVGAIEDEDEAV